MERQIKIMEKYFELICDIGYDYDGYNDVEGLKSVIDEMIHFASLGRVANDTEPIFSSYQNGQSKEINILGKEIKK